MRPLLFGVLLGCSLVLSIQALYSSSDDVVELTPSNFKREVIQSDSLWLVEFYAPWCGHCKSLAPEWKKVASALKGVVKVGAVDADQHQSLGSEYSVRGFPTIKIFGANKNKPEEYQGGRSAQAIIDQTLNTLRAFIKDRQSGKGGGSKSTNNQGSSGGGGSTGSGDKKDVVELTDDNFDKMVLGSEDIWLVEFFAPWCGHCKNLEPEWTAAASAIKEQTKGKVHLGAVDATVHRDVSGRYGIRGFPTIKIFRKGEEPQNYEGGRTRGDIIEKALELFSDNAPAPEVLELLNEEIFKTTCADSQLCIIAMLPHILDTGASGRNSYLDIMKQMAEKYKKKMWGWLWAEAGTQRELEVSLEIGGFGYPAMAAINPRKKMYALLKGSFSTTGIHEFLREVSVGRGSTYKWGKGNEMPKINAVDSWDGLDGQFPVEEDVDLSDVDLSDDYGSKIEL